jgi:nicotinamide mononucleotide transporter
MISAASLLIAFVLLTPVLQSLGAAATWSDAIIFLGSAFAQVIMVYEKYEAWPLWFAINVLATVQYAVLGYWFTSVLYAAFTIVALLGWKRWYESHRSAH